MSFTVDTKKYPRIANPEELLTSFNKWRASILLLMGIVVTIGVLLALGIFSFGEF